MTDSAPLLARSGNHNGNGNGQGLERLKEHVRAANGMCDLEVYEALWNCAASVSGDSFLEVGTAHGAATIALALGAKSAGKPVRIVTIDRLGGKFCSRSRFGDVEQNKAIVLENFARADVADSIRLFVGTTDEFMAAGQCPARIDLLMLDADGRIDRDLLHFYDSLADNAVVVIDDVDPGVFIGATHDGIAYMDMKHRITSLLLSAFEKAGYLIIDQTVCGTAFCRRGARPLDKQEFLQLSLGCYRELVFSDLTDPYWRQLVQWHQDPEKVRQALKVYAAVPSAVLSGARWVHGLFSAARGEKGK